MPGVSEKLPLMTQGQWMKGCPEGSEQSFLFSLYRELSEGECPCPHGCGASITRKKSDFFTMFVSTLRYAFTNALSLTVHSLRSMSTSNIYSP